LAECLDGIDLSHYRVGQVLDLSDHEARLLVAERWAIPYVAARPRRPVTPARSRECSSVLVRAEAADASTRRTRTLDQLRHVRDQMEQGRFDQHEHRRAEDRIREELQDSRATTVRHP
jgi:hypothetical protein